MKQGQASTKGPAGRKQEPSSRVVNPGGVDREGQALGNHSMDQGTVERSNFTNMYGGRGYEAPGIGKKYNKSGSQGKY
jgi:hypothetical protein